MIKYVFCTSAIAAGAFLLTHFQKGNTARSNSTGMEIPRSESRLTRVPNIMGLADWHSAGRNVTSEVPVEE